ncbi:Hypothetical protein NCS54_01497400 [Fusarium falciforme]|uniref:Hypothetical protein n=1 Tax=Fusarium falciforme TaxID=195108 RepID=UPI0023013603|nr:Hypothetical protein NCS54_01497400 [Fusarium falciforme]WAO97257.1 Hypothetical protein NCS54_01497400 [Fusarium falciforme]
MAEPGSTESKAQPQVNLDGLGIFWIAFALSWTLIVAGGMIFLWHHRDMPILRIRGLPLSLLAITLLHFYWGTVQTGYVYLPLAIPEVEYWIMSIYLPCGIALFHASNTRFLLVAKAQKELFTSDAASIQSKRAKTNSLICRFRSLDYTKKILILVGAGMGFQFLLTLFMYLISRKFHPSFGILGTELTVTEDFRESQMGRGWEWWPSVFWQLFWAWIVAPYILWHARRIDDTQGWRTQTIACCLSRLVYLNINMPDSTLTAKAVFMLRQCGSLLYMSLLCRRLTTSGFRLNGKLSRIAISIMMLEIITIFLPCWEVVRHQTLRRETIDSIAQWQQNKRRIGMASKSIATSSTTAVSSSRTRWSKDGSTKSDSDEILLTMEALECVLERNPGPLQQFSALRDFSGENIAFLRAVAYWRFSLPAAVRNPDKVKDNAVQELIREQFNSALQIYTDFVSSRDAKFPINLSSQDLKRLEFVFEPSARILCGEKRDVDPATPFESFAMATKVEPSSASSHGSEAGILTGSVNETDAMGDKALYWGDIPDGFNVTIFDDAEASIKYLVLTNTWPKFVKERRCSINSNDTIEAGNAIPATR